MNRSHMHDNVRNKKMEKSYIYAEENMRIYVGKPVCDYCEKELRLFEHFGMTKEVCMKHYPYPLCRMACLNVVMTDNTEPIFLHSLKEYIKMLGTKPNICRTIIKDNGEKIINPAWAVFINTILTFK